MLMDLLGSGSPAPPPAAPTMAAGGGMDAMAAMMGGPAMSMGAPAPPPAAPGSFPPFTAFEKNGLQIVFACSKDPANPSITSIEATFTNGGQVPIAGLNFQVAVPKYMKLQMQTASGNALPPANSGKVTQLFKR